MAWDEPFPVETGDTITKALWNKDVVSNTIALQGEDQRLANILADHDQHLTTIDNTLLYVAGHPIYYPGFTSGEQWTGDGAWWHFNTSTHQGCPAESGDVISVSCSYWRGGSSNITAARLYVTHAYLPLAHCHGQTWYIAHNLHGTYGTVQANFVVQPNMIQGDRVYLSVNMNNGGVASLDEFTCHGWANHGKALVHSPRDFEGEVNEAGLPVIPPTIEEPDEQAD